MNCKELVFDVEKKIDRECNKPRYRGKHLLREARFRERAC
jgi:hypothetical protein